MKQLFQSLSNGNIEALDIPVPSLKRGCLLIKTSYSLLSPGTERMLVDFGKANWIDKARMQPDKVKDVVDKARNDGLVSTFEAVKSKLEAPLPLGYSNVGTVIAVGENVLNFKVGDRIASNGPHAEVVCVPHHLCALIPDEVDDESAVFTIVSSIGLQGIRLANPTFGETFLVSGLGLIGLLTAQMLVKQGCRVLGVDPDASKCSLAESLGISTLNLSNGIDPVGWCLDETLGVGIDGALITAATSSSDPIHIAAMACRHRGRIVLVGVTGMELRRDLFYKKELTFQVSCSYGPGRYDNAYEQNGHDYPIGFVRWTEQRNFQAVLNTLATRGIEVAPLISHRFPFEKAIEAFELLVSSEDSLAILLEYSRNVDHVKSTLKLRKELDFECETKQKPIVGVIGVGNYASRFLIPSLYKAGAKFSTIVSSHGLAPLRLGRKFGFAQASTNVKSIFDDPKCNTVVITTRHDSHAALVQEALAKKKNVFVEKPLCLTIKELEKIESIYTGKQILMVGFNRRFAPLTLDLKKELNRFHSPVSFVFTCNAGYIPKEHWTQDPSLGGGRLIGEACHFIDLLRYLAGSPIESSELITMKDTKVCPDTFSLQLRFKNGSIGTIHYFSNGNKSFPKERLEVFSEGSVLRLENFMKLKAWGINGFQNKRKLIQDKGQQNCTKAFLKAIETGEPPIPVEEIFEVQRILLELLKS